MRSLIAAIERIDPLTISGRVAAVNGLLIEARGGLTRLAVGARVEIDRLGLPVLPAEVVGFRETRALLMPFGPVEGVAPGAEIRIMPEGASVRPTKAWLGRIINAFGEPIDGLGPLPQGEVPYPLKTPPPPAHARGRVGERLDLGVRSMNVFTTTCRGQRLGDHMLAMRERLQAMLDGCYGVASALHNDVNQWVRDHSLPVFGDPGCSRFDSVLCRACLGQPRFPTYARKIGARRVGGQVGNRNQVNAWRAGDLRQVHAAKLACTDEADADGVIVKCTLLEFCVEVHGVLL